MDKTTPFIIVGNTKSMDFSPWGGIEGFLRDTSNGAGGYSEINLLKRISPFLSRAVDMTANAAANLPFDILDDAGDVKDKSEDWKNVMGGMPNPRRLLYQIASSLCMGRAYVIPQYTGTLITDLRYVATHTVLPLITTEGLQWFSRASDYGNAGVYSPIIPFNATKTLESSSMYEKLEKPDVDEKYIDNVIKGYTGDIDKDKLKAILLEQNSQSNFTGVMMYFWLPDSDIEIGPAKMHPLGTAQVPSEVAAALDNTVKLLAQRNFVPPTVITATGIPPQDREATKNWLNGFMKGAFQSVYRIFNAEKFNAVQVGAGMDDLKGTYSEIKRQAIEEIGSAFGIPAALFLSDKAFASEVYPMVKQWYETAEFVKIYQTIQETFNDQLLSNYGWTMKFDLERLSAFSQDESNRAVSMRDYVSARIRPSIAFQILGGKMPEGYEYSALDEDYDKPEPDLPVNPINNPALPPTEGKDPEASAVNRDDNLIGKSLFLSPNEMKEIGLWYEVAKRKFLKGEGLAVDWKCKFLSLDMQSHIRERLAVAKTGLDIVKAFEITAIAQSEEKSDLQALADALNRNADIEERKHNG